MDLEAIVRTFIFPLRRLEAIKSFKQSSETSYDMILKDRSGIQDCDKKVIPLTTLHD